MSLSKKRERWTKNTPKQMKRKNVHSKNQYKKRKYGSDMCRKRRGKKSEKKRKKREKERRERRKGKGKQKIQELPMGISIPLDATSVQTIILVSPFLKALNSSIRCYIKLRDDNEERKIFFPSPSFLCITFLFFLSFCFFLF